MRRSWCCALVLVASLAACGTTNDRYRALDNAEVSKAFLETNTTTTTVPVFRPPQTTTTSTVAPSTTTTIPTETVIIYFVTDDGKLRGVKRVHPVGSSRDVIIADLRAAPTPADGPGLRTLVDNQNVKSVDFTGAVPVIDLSPVVNLPGVTDEERFQIAGQIAATLTKLPNVWQVSFTVEGKPWKTALPDGQVASRLVSGADFASLFAP
jgi:spore germination protein GerM